jgi:hypothetical protein
LFKNSEVNEPGAVAHAYNPANLGGRDRKDLGLQFVRVKTRDPTSKITKSKTKQNNIPSPPKNKTNIF